MKSPLRMTLRICVSGSTGDPVPRKEDNGVDVTKVTAVKVLEVADYH